MTALIGNPLLLTSAPAAGGDAYQIEKSLRFNSGDDPYLLRTPGTSGNLQTYTYSFWFKTCVNKTNHQYLFTTSTGGSPSFVRLLASNDGYASQLQVVDDTMGWGRILKPKIRDHSAWRHLCVSVDSTSAGISVFGDRVKIYLNGILQESFDGTSNVPSQNAAGIFNKANEPIYIGGQNATDNHFDGYISDFQVINGLALSPAAFGQFSSSGVWDPKAFATPAPNTGVTWSSSYSGSAWSGYPFSMAFDGDVTTGTEAASNSTNTWTPSSPIVATSQIRVNVYCKSNNISTNYDFKINGNSVLHDVVNKLGAATQGWYTLDTRTLTSLQTGNDAGGSTWMRLYAIEIDGVILVDGQTDPTTRVITNDGTIWSNGTVSGAGSPISDLDHAFDGDSSTLIGDSGGASAEWVVTLPKSITGVTKVEIQPGSSQPNDAKFKCDIGGTTHTYTVSGGSHPEWVPVYNGAAGTLTAIRGQRTSSNTGGAIRGVRVNGQVLIDGQADNSFHLKFNDTSLNRYLGKDTLNGKIAAATGGKPIYNTTDDYGDVKGSGYVTDSSAGTTNGTGLVFAVPGDSVASGTCDVHQSINTGSSNVAMTNSGVVVATDESRLYGSSLYFNGSSHLLNTNDNADFTLDGDFTVEWWLKCTETSNAHQIWGDYYEDGSNTSGEFHFVYEANNQRYSLYSNPHGSVLVDVPAKYWHHVAVTRSGSTTKVYVNGTLKVTSTQWGTNTLGLGGNYRLGRNGNDGDGLIGWLNDFRIYKGVVKYTANFKPPTRNDFTVNNLNESTGTTTPAGAATGGLPILNVTTSAGTAYASPISAATDGISNKQLYLPFQGANGGSTFTDYSGNNRTPDDVTGTPSTSTGSSKFGGVSGYFDGTTDYLKWDQAAWQISANTTDWTVEFWFRWDSGSSGNRGICGMLGNGGYNQSWFVALDSNHKIKTEFTLGTSWRNITCDNAISADTWTHVSCCVHGGTYTMYINGTAQSTTVSGISGTTSLPSNPEPFYIGTLGHNSYSEFKGYIQDFRLVDDGLHTGNFTVPGTVPYFVPDSGLDSLVDSPTNYGTGNSGGDVRGNHCTWNPLAKSASVTLSNGNLQQVGTAAWDATMGTFGVNTGKWYYEVTMTSGTYSVYGVADASNTDLGTDPYNNAKAVTYIWDSGKVCNGDISSPLETVGTSAAGDVVGIAFDADAKKVWFLKNGTSLSGTPGSSGGYTLPTADFYTPFGDCYSATTQANFGQRAFEKTVPSGFQALCTQNLDNTFDSETSENNPSKYFDALHYVGNDAATRAMKTAGGFGPDFVWWKRRTQDTANIHKLYARGIADNHIISSDTKNAQGWDEDQHGYLDSLDSDGYTIKDGSSGGNGTNEGGDSYISWMWDAGTSAATASTDGSITPSEQWVNATAGFSITKWTATNANATIGHGLGAPPEFIILKNIDAVVDWGVYHVDLGNTARLKLNTTGGTSTHSTFWQDTSPTNTVFSVGTSGDFNGSTNNIIAWSWTPIAGYSAFGKFTGNAAADGPFQYCGFKPRYLLIKSLANSRDWLVWDSARTTANGALRPNEAVAELTGNATNIDFLSNGFKMRTDYTNMNAAEDHIWAAFAEHPFKTARAK